jgi:asparagine synthase (glutamine-hydrolysing)
MCGIASFFYYNAHPEPNAVVNWLSVANRVQQTRGPDGKGLWVSKSGTIGLGHRRLAIIDLSRTGAQPMATEDGLLRITYNGEIYNYKALRRKLESRGYRFRSNSDTEVLLHLYREYGQAMTEHLRGMYAFALWDKKKSGLFLVRDPFGIKPLYYADDGHTIRAASQVKTLLVAGGADTSLDPAGHVGFFLWGYLPEPFTLYKGIRALPAGKTLWVAKGDTRPKQKIFCDVAQEIAQPLVRNFSMTYEEVAEALGEALRDSVHHHMVSDVPVGVFLSAGLDSTSIAALAAGCTGGEPLRTFTLGFIEYRETQNDETPLAETAARALGAHHETGWVLGKDFAKDLEKIFTAMDQPTIDGVNTYFVSKAAAQAGLKVVLSGLGGDELLGGYPSFKHIPKIIKVGTPFHAIGRLFRSISEPVIRRFTSPKYAGIFEYGGSMGGAYLLRRGLYMPWELPDILDPDIVCEGWKQLAPVARINYTIPKGAAAFSAISALESTWYMRNMLLRDSDWAGMAHSLEIRVPLVDLVLMRVLAPLMKHNQRPDKKLLAQCAWPEGPPRVLLNRAKTCFSIPIRQWLLEEADSLERGNRAWAKVVYRKALGII